jgi:phosphoribosylformylglycinamidine cyclo-ligase
MTTEHSLSYRATGVVDNTQLGLGGLLRWVNATAAFRSTGPGRRVVDVGYFASVVAITDTLGLALCTDGVGSKVLVAEMLGRYDTIGIDCVAMNVNDAICVGAEPISFLDYIAVERAAPEMLEQIARGLHAAPEHAQAPDQNIKGHAGIARSVGMCAAIVLIAHPGARSRPATSSSACAAAGFTATASLARKALEISGLAADQYLPELGCTVGEELLRPTDIYVRPVMELLRAGAPVRALVNITGDGFLNLARIRATVGFDLDNLPEPQPIFRLIQTRGDVSDPEMYRVFNMGIGFCLIVPDDLAVLQSVKETFASHRFETHRIGKVVAGEGQRVALPKQKLIGEGDGFRYQ